MHPFYRLSSGSSCSPDSEFEGISKPSSPDITEYSADDIYVFVRETNLCKFCQVIFGPTDQWITRDGDGIPAHEHHPSLKSLLRSKKAGCLLCTRVYKDCCRSRPSLLAYPSEERAQAGSLVRGGPFTCSFQLWVDSPRANLTIRIQRRASEAISFSSFGIVEFPSPRHLLPLSCPCENILPDIVSWVADCRGEYEHVKCQQYRCPSLPFKKPTRLVHFGPGRLESVQLVAVEADQSYPYVTLSHRWRDGLHKPPRLSRSNQCTDGRISIERLEKGVPISGLPRTFRDAMQIVHACGLSYIWIDFLCIVQDFDQEGCNWDWAEEADKMGDIYAGGIFNIAAVDGKDSEAGLFPQPRGLSLPVVEIASNKSAMNQGTYALVRSPYSKNVRNAIDGSELLSRGWVFQEVLLTPANLFCTKEQMSWSCLETSFSQRFHKITNMPHTFKDATLTRSSDTTGHRKREIFRTIEDGSVGDPIKVWGGLMDYYSKTSVTFDGDRMVAIAGIAQRFASWFPELQGAVCHSGIWSVDVPRQLLWVKDLGYSRSSARMLSKFTRSHPIPSWSPLCCASQVGWPFLTHPEDQRVRQLAEHVTMFTTGLDQFGRVSKEDVRLKHCVLHLRGIIADIVFDDDLGNTGKASFAGQTAPTASRIDVFLDTREDEQAVSPEYGHQFGAFPCSVDQGLESHYSGTTIRGLLLRAIATETTRESSGKCSTWVRCGYFKFHTEKRQEHHFMSAFQLGRYGLYLMFKAYPDEQNAGQNNDIDDTDGQPSWGGLWKIEPTGEAPDLEDIYII